MKNTISKDTQGHKFNCDKISLSLSSLSFQHNIYVIGKDDGVNQRRTIYEVIDDLYFEKFNSSLNNLFNSVKKMQIFNRVSQSRPGNN